VLWEGRSLVVRSRLNGGSIEVQAGGFEFDVTVRDPREMRSAGANSAAHGRCEVTAPMPGKVIRLLVSEGDQVEAGQGIIVVEAMKMQNEMQASRAGRVTQVRVQAGAAVSAGDVLAVIE
jgi:biotin carboxyl carrier protein